MSLTVATRVLHRLGLTEKSLPFEEVEEYIEDAQAFIEAEAERTFLITDSDYNLARSACTDLAAAYALIRLLGGSYSGLTFEEADSDLQRKQVTKVELVNKYLARVNAALAKLRPKATALLPKSSTYS